MAPQIGSTFKEGIYTPPASAKALSPGTGRPSRTASPAGSAAMAPSPASTLPAGASPTGSWSLVGTPFAHTPIASPWGSTASMAPGNPFETRMPAVASGVPQPTEPQPAASARRTRPSGIAWRKWLGSLGRVGRAWWLSPGAVLMLAMWISPPSFSPTLAKGVGAVISFSEDLADAGGILTRAASNVTVLVTDAAVAFGRGSMSAVEETWVGVDLLNSTVNATGGRFVVLQGYYNSGQADPLGLALARLPFERSAEIWLALNRIDASMPAIARTDQYFAAANRYEAFEFEVQLLKTYYIGVRFSWWTVSFQPVWANPIWEWFGCDVTSQVQKIGERVQKNVESTLDLSWLHVPLHKADVPADLYPPLWYRLLRHVADSWRLTSIASGSGL